MTIVATDGSCLENPGGRSAWAWCRDDGTKAAGFIASGTNQIAELAGVLAALKAHRDVDDLTLECDSAYAINCATQWIDNWRRKGWKNSAGKPVKNQDLIKAIDAELQARDVPAKFRKVKGHAAAGTHPLNEAADVLAGETARSGIDVGEQGNIMPEPLDN